MRSAHDSCDCHVCVWPAMKRSSNVSNRGSKDTGASKRQCSSNYNICQYFISSSVIQNEINVPGCSAGACTNTNKDVPERKSESSSNSSDSESDSDQENSTPSTSYCTLRDDESVGAMHSAISSGDFGQVAQLKAKRQLTDHEKLTLLSTHFVAPRNYKFPTRNVGGRGRCFQHSWLKKHNGLVYSESQDGGYCKYCVLFARDGLNITLGALVNRPLIDSTEKLAEHFFSKKFHRESLEKAALFTKMMNNPDLTVDHRLSSERSMCAAENRLKLKSIAETVIFCGRQGLAFRGHRDDTPTKENLHANHGNFLGLLQFRVQAGYHILKQHLEHAAGNALYTSKTVQNTICGDIIRSKLIKMIQKAGFFSVIADEATDVANDEQLSICICFVDCGLPCEKFLAFHECQSGVTGMAIADNILSKLTEWQLQPQLLCGQAYDGAGAMVGKFKGVAARIYSQYPKALYTHCASHRLNLCVVKCCSIREVSNMMQTADKISRFFNNSPKRQVRLEEWIESTLPEENQKKLKELCRTRWVERHEAFEVFSDLFLPIFCCFEAIVHSSSSDWNRETRSDAQSFLLAVTILIHCCIGACSESPGLHQRS